MYWKAMQLVVKGLNCSVESTAETSHFM